LGLRDREHPGPQTILLPVVLPHPDEVLRANDERVNAVVILEDTGERGSHERLSQTHYVADEHPSPLVEVVCCDLDSRLLELEEFVAEVAGDAELRQPCPSLLGKVIGRLDVDVIRGNRFGTRPTVVDDVDEFLGDVDAEPVVSSILEPCGELVAGIMVKDIYVEFALLGEPGQSQVTAAQVTDLGIEWVLSEQQVQLGVKRVAKEELDHQLSGRDLRCKTTQTLLVCVCRNAHHQLVAKILGELSLQCDGRGLIDLLLPLDQAHG